MEKKNIILIAIAILVIALIAVAAFIYMGENAQKEVIANITGNATNDTVIDVDDAEKNLTVVGDNSTRANDTGNATNQTYKVYNPQSDSYVEVIGEKFDEDVNRWYTYDTDGVRYYNTRIN